MLFVLVKMASFLLECRHLLRNVRFMMECLHKGPPLEPALCGGAHSSLLPTGLKSFVDELIDFKGFLWAAPKHKTHRDRKACRKFARPAIRQLMRPKKNVVPCQVCGTWRELHTICGACYEKVREETDKIKEKLTAYNPFKGELPDREAFVCYKGEEKQMFEGKRVIEMDRERPGWFSKDLKKRWQFLKAPAGIKVEEN